MNAAQAEALTAKREKEVARRLLHDAEARWGGACLGGGSKPRRRDRASLSARGEPTHLPPPPSQQARHAGTVFGAPTLPSTNPSPLAPKP